MIIDTRIIFDNGKSGNGKIEINFPTHCPACKAAIFPTYLSGSLNVDSKTFYAMFECRNCHNAFIMTIDRIGKNVNSDKYILSKDSTIRYAPNKQVAREFSEHITSISPQFIKIYNQALAAESNNLDEIAGIGYRKALEFLIKDYLCKDKNDDEKQMIIKKFLGNVIKDDVINPNIKIVAERAVWLGNDEAHYYRKWEDKDITDLKDLVDMSVRWIELELITQKYFEEMPSGKK